MESKPLDPTSLDGLNQSFKLKDGKYVKLQDFLKEGDWWELKSRKKVSYIILHDAVKKIADAAGIQGDPTYTILTQPSTTNNYTYLMQVKICDDLGRCTVELGESSRSNLGVRGRSNPANMAQKRAFDRAVLRHLGVQGLIGEDELPDEEEPKEMDKLSHEEQKEIAPELNTIFAIKTKAEATAFRAQMAKSKGKFKEGQLDVLRALFRKKLSELEKSF